ncbi:MAG: hypothetical protein AB7S26_21045 [Sandaracinaceae bacterium]
MALPPLTIDPLVAQRCVKITDERGDDPRGHYELLMPEQFRPVDKPFGMPSNEESPVQVSLFQTMEPPLAELEITGMFLRREIAPADMLELLLADQTIVEQRRVPSPGGDLLDALTRVGGERPYYSRWWTVKDGGSDGGRLYVLEARAEEAIYPQVQDQLSTMLASWKLLHPTDWDYFEELRQLARRTPNDFVFFYPASWQIDLKTDEPDEVMADLWQVMGDKLAGRITVLSRPGQIAPDAAIDRYAESLGAPVAWTDLEEMAPFGGLERAWTRRGRTHLGEAVADLTVRVGQKGGGTIVFALAGVSASVDAFAYASMRRALDVLTETFRIS